MFFNAMSRKQKQLYNKLSDANSELEERVNELSEINMRLKFSEKNLSNMINTMVDGIIVINGQGLINNFNPAAESIFG